MSLSIPSAIVAHKFIAAFIIASLVTAGGGAIAATHQSSSNSLGTMSFAVNQSINVTSLASLDFGSLSAGQSKTFTSTAVVNVSTPGIYGISLVNEEILHEVFSNFSVTVSGLSSSPVVLNLTHESQQLNLTSGVHSLTITVGLTVNNTLDHSVDTSNTVFLSLGTPHSEMDHFGVTQPIAHDDGKDSEGDH